MLAAVVLVGVLASATLLLGWAFGRYNRLVRARHEVDNAASQVHVELQARHDLVPALVECVREHTSHERQIIERVVDAHARALQVTGTSAETFSRENGLSAALLGFQRVFSVGYPVLKADASFVALSSRLVEIEERLTRSRQYYNDAVFRLASGAAEFPGNLFAESAGIRDIPPYFRAVEGAESAPRISLSAHEQNLPTRA
jgi:LemA protein